MRIERLEVNKIKISLTEMDFINFDIDKKELALNSKVLRDFILRIMDEINRKTDFKPYSGNIVVRATQSNEGMSIIVSKVSTKHKYTKEEIKKAKNIRLVVKRHKTNIDAGFITYYFDDFEDLCNALCYMDDEFIKESYVYKYKEVYCLIIALSDADEETQRFCFKNVSILKEYSSRYITGKLGALHIQEQGKFISKGASLGAMTEGIRKIK